MLTNESRKPVLVYNNNELGIREGESPDDLNVDKQLSKGLQGSI